MKFYNYILLGTFLFTSIGTQISSAKVEDVPPPGRWTAIPTVGIGIDSNGSLSFVSDVRHADLPVRQRVVVHYEATHHFLRSDRYGRPYGTQVMAMRHNFQTVENPSYTRPYIIDAGYGSMWTRFHRLRPSLDESNMMERLGWTYTGTLYRVLPQAYNIRRTYIVDTDNDSYYDEVNRPARRLSSNISKGKWKLDPIEGTKQMRYYRFDMVEPVGLDSIVITFNKTYRNANIRLLNGNTTVRMIDAGYAQPNKPLVVKLHGIKVTRVEITPISSTSDIKEIHVYSTNFAHGENIQAVKGGKIVPVARYIWDPEKATDGVNDPKNDPINQWKRYVTHMSNVGTRLDLEGPHNVGYVKIAGLVGASDGIRNITVTYRDIKGAAKKVENLGFHIRNNRASTVIVEAPTKGQGSKGINDIASIDITSEDVELKYAEIEVYGPADKPN